MPRSTEHGPNTLLGLTILGLTIHACTGTGSERAKDEDSYAHYCLLSDVHNDFLARALSVPCSGSAPCLICQPSLGRWPAEHEAQH